MSGWSMFQSRTGSTSRSAQTRDSRVASAKACGGALPDELSMLRPHSMASGRKAAEPLAFEWDSGRRLQHPESSESPGWVANLGAGARFLPLCLFPARRGPTNRSETYSKPPRSCICEKTLNFAQHFSRCGTDTADLAADQREREVGAGKMLPSDLARPTPGTLVVHREMSSISIGLDVEEFDVGVLHGEVRIESR